MNTPISAEELCKVYHNAYNVNESTRHDRRCAESQAHAPALQAVASFVEEKVSPKWIPVDEKLPEDRQHVLAFGFDSDGESFQMVEYYIVEHPGWTRGVVTHWMLLPPAPKPVE